MAYDEEKNLEIPCVFVLCTRKTEYSYKFIMRLIEHTVYDLAIENRWKISDVEELHTDFEKGEMNSIVTVYT